MLTSSLQALLIHGAYNVRTMVIKLVSFLEIDSAKGFQSWRGYNENASSTEDEWQNRLAWKARGLSAKASPFLTVCLKHHIGACPHLKRYDDGYPIVSYRQYRLAGEI
jgi:hypothetical protein